MSRIENSNNFCQTGRLKTHRSCFFKLSGPICESHACRAHASVKRSQLSGKPQFYCIRTHTGASAHLADMRQKLMQKDVASLLVAPSQPFNAPKRWGSGLKHHPGAPAASWTVLGMSRMRPGSASKRPTSIPEPLVSVPPVPDRFGTSQKAAGLILQRFGFDLGVSDKIRQPPPRLLRRFFCRHCAPAARLEPPFLFKALAAVLHVASNFTSCLMCRCFSIDSPFFKSALNHEPVISEVGVAVVGWRLQGHLTYPGT